MNLNFIVSRALTPIYPIVQVQLYTYKEQTNVLGTVTVTYNDPITLDANVQFAKPERLRHLHTYQQTRIYRDFWINKQDITGLNRNIGTGGDYLVFEGFYYRVVAVDEEFKTGWVLVTGIQSVSLDEQ